jgi:hypothetical protein
VNPAGHGVAGMGAMAEMAGYGICRSGPDARVWTGMKATSDAPQTCSANRGVLVDAAEFSSADLAVDQFKEGPGTLEPGVASLHQFSSEQAALLVAELASVTPGQTPAGTKVPEPSTLVLLGAGMIATSGLSRVKRQPKPKLRVAATRLGAVLQH